MTAPVISLTYEWYRAVKSATSCIVDGCGSREYLNFHHVDPNPTLGNVSDHARTSTIGKVQREMEKCVPVCEAHHAEIHAGRRKGWLVGRFTNGVQTWDDSEARKHMPFKPFSTGLVRNQKVASQP